MWSLVHLNVQVALVLSFGLIGSIEAQIPDPPFPSRPITICADGKQSWVDILESYVEGPMHICDTSSLNHVNGFTCTRSQH